MKKVQIKITIFVLLMIKSHFSLLEQLNSCGNPPSPEDIWNEDAELKSKSLGPDRAKLEPL